MFRTMDLECLSHISCCRFSRKPKINAAYWEIDIHCVGFRYHRHQCVSFRMLEDHEWESIWFQRSTTTVFCSFSSFAFHSFHLCLVGRSHFQAAMLFTFIPFTIFMQTICSILSILSILYNFLTCILNIILVMESVRQLYSIIRRIALLPIYIYTSNMIHILLWHLPPNEFDLVAPTHYFLSVSLHFPVHWKHFATLQKSLLWMKIKLYHILCSVWVFGVVCTTCYPHIQTVLTCNSNSINFDQIYCSYKTRQ